MRHKTLAYLRSFFIASAAIALLFTAGVGFVGERIGATITLGQLAKIQSVEHDKIVMPFDLRYWAALKLPRLEIDRPEIIYISSSRAGAAQARMFQPYSFYNMSFTAWTLDQVIDVFDRATRNNAARIVIVEIDYFMLTDTWERGNLKNNMIFDWPMRYVLTSAVDMVRSAARHPELLSYMRAPDRLFVGTQAVLINEGFRFDGSYVYSSGHTRDSAEHHINAETLVQAMPGGSAISKKQMGLLRKLAALARQRQITLVGVQLPLFKEGVDYLDTNQSYYPSSGVWREFESASTREAFQEMGIHFFDLAHDQLNSEKENFFDAYHPSTLGMLRSMQSLLRVTEFRNLFPAIEPHKIDKQIAEEAVSHPEKF
jgi:hypothetical protein